MKPINYRVVMPARDVGNLVQAYVFCDLEPGSRLVLPPSTKNTIGFIYSDRFSVKKADGNETPFHRRFVTGGLIEPLVLDRKPFPINAAIAILKPGVLYSIMKSDIKEAVNQLIHTDDLLSKQKISWVNDALSSAKTDQEKEAYLNKFFRETIKQETPAFSPVFQEAIFRIEQSQGFTHMYDLSRVMGITERHLFREFKKFRGISPKQFNTIVRMKKIIQEIRCNPNLNWAEFADASGFADQSHFIKKFRFHNTITPSEFHRSFHDSDNIDQTMLHYLQQDIVNKDS